MTHGLASHLTTQAQVRAIRGNDGGRALGGKAGLPGRAAAVAGYSPSPWVGRDGMERALVCAAMDAQNRVAITKLAPALDWPPNAPVVVHVEPGRVRVALGVPMSPTEIASRYVAGRLTLPAAARARLDLAPGDAVVATTAGDGQIVLVAGADIAQLITGTAEHVSVPLEELASTQRRGVKPAWQPPTTATG